MWLGPVLLYNPKPAGLTVTNIDSILSLFFFKAEGSHKHMETEQRNREEGMKGTEEMGKVKKLNPSGLSSMILFISLKCWQH